jgi:hypothetical protein
VQSKELELVQDRQVEQEKLGQSRQVEQEERLLEVSNLVEGQSQLQLLAQEALALDRPVDQQPLETTWQEKEALVETAQLGLEQRLEAQEQKWEDQEQKLAEGLKVEVRLEKQL